MLLLVKEMYVKGYEDVNRKVVLHALMFWKGNLGILYFFD